MGARSLSLRYSLPSLPWLSYASVPQSAFLGSPRHTTLANNTLGKRPRSHRYSPVLTDEQRRKRPRYIASDGYALGGNDRPPAPPHSPAAPWHQNDRFVRKFNREEFEGALVVPPTISSQIAQFPFGNDVEFPIHPIFRSLTGLVPELYPSLRLATRFLSSRQTLPFFHNLITSPLTFLQFESQYYNAPLTHLAPSPFQATGLPDSARELTLQTLLSLAPHIDLQISPDPRLAVRWAYTERNTLPQHPTAGLASAYSTLPQLFPTPAQLHNSIQPKPSYNPLLALNFRGTNALINISPCFLRTLHPHTFPAPTQAQKLRCAFMLAVTLVHELAHAVYVCRFPGAPLVPDPHATAPAPPEPSPTRRAASCPPSSDSDTSPPSTRQNDITRSNGKAFPQPQSRLYHSYPSIPSRFRKAYEDHEPFFGTHRKPELGHAWETTVFGGGKVSSLASCDNFSLGLGWQRWPGTDEFYVQNWRGEVVPLARKIHPGGGGVSGEPIFGRAPKWETVYVVSDAWVWKWFLSEFWAMVEVAGLRGALGRVEKRLGARVRNYDWVDAGEGDGWESACSSRERGADGEGVVRVGQAWVESEDEMDESDDEDDLDIGGGQGKLHS